ncbi:MAG: hypothetical protein ABDI19_12805 [Armatimonadota bacterium]
MRRRKTGEASVRNDEITFANLALVYTEPLFWEPRPLEHPECLRRFLHAFLDPSKPGTAFLGVPGERQGEGDWLTGEQAISAVDQLCEQVWLVGGHLLERYGRVISERIFDELFTRHRVVLFLDQEKFIQTCLEHPSLPVEVKGLLYQPEELCRDYYLRFYIDWSFSGGILWTPQLFISNFWPASRRIAPPPPEGLRSPRPIEPAQAAHILENFFWKRVETAFRALRRIYGLGSAHVRVRERQFESPVFYYAEPAAMPPKPEDIIEKHEYIKSLEQICRVTLGTHDPLSADVAGAFLEGNLLTLRREIRGQRQIGVYYLVVPWGSEKRAEWGEEVERELLFIADKWFYVEFCSAYEAYDAITDIEMWSEPIALWAGSLDTAATLTRQLQQLAAFEPVGSERKSKAFNLVNQIRSVLARLESEMLRVTDDVIGLERKFKHHLEATIHFARRAFTSRALPRVGHLMEAIAEFFPYRYGSEIVQHAAQRAEQLRDTFDGVERSIQDLLDQQRRDEQEREEKRREEEVQREERRQRILGYGLAFLATITAFPLLIGQMNWQELQHVIGHWPAKFQWLGNLLREAHPYLVLIATLSAGIIITFLLTMIIWTAVASRSKRKAEEQQDEWQQIGRQIMEVWQLVNQIMPDIRKLRKQAFVSRAQANETDDVRSLRQRVDEKDREACDMLLKVWQWLRQFEYHDESILPRMADLEQKVHRFVILTELLDNRPVPFPFPVALCLFRYKSTDFVGSSVVSDFEFEQIFHGYGYDDDEVEAIEQWVDQPLRRFEQYRTHPLAEQEARLRDLPAEEFIVALREVIGVSALHSRKIRPPEEE